MKQLSDGMIDRIVERFRAFGDPTRIRLLMALHSGELAVSELVLATGVAQASVSKHLDKLRQVGLVKSRRDGNQVFYSVCDPEIFQLCELMCGGVSRFMQQQQQAIL